MKTIRNSRTTVKASKIKQLIKIKNSVFMAVCCFLHLSRVLKRTIMILVQYWRNANLFYAALCRFIHRHSKANTHQNKMMIKKFSKKVLIETLTSLLIVIASTKRILILGKVGL